MALTAAIVVRPGIGGADGATSTASAPTALNTTAVSVGAPQPQIVGHLVMTGGGTWSTSGTSRWWPWGENALVQADVFGHRNELGDRAAGQTCRVTVIDRLVLSVRCQSPV
jgi:hypothetical protein